MEITLLDAPEDPVEDGATFSRTRAQGPARPNPLNGRRMGRGRGLRLEVAALGGRPASSRPGGRLTVSRGYSSSSRFRDRGRGTSVSWSCSIQRERSCHATGTLAGEIAHERRGSGGFGYDPVSSRPASPRPWRSSGTPEGGALAPRAGRAALAELLTRPCRTRYVAPCWYRRRPWTQRGAPRAHGVSSQITARSCSMARVPWLRRRRRVPPPPHGSRPRPRSS